MRVSLRILCQKDATAALATDPEVARACDLSATVVDLAADSKAEGWCDRGGSRRLSQPTTSDALALRFGREIALVLC